VVLNSVRDAIRAGFGYVPADRLKQGLFLEQSIARNVIAGSLDRLVGRLNLLRQSVADRLAETSLTNLHVKMSTSRALARSLSGGNQQRVVLAKWLARSPRVLILNSPTVGVDVGSKHEILEMLRAKSREGIGIIVISDDVPELFEVCHRVLVVRRGRIVPRRLDGRTLQLPTHDPPRSPRLHRAAVRLVMGRRPEGGSPDDHRRPPVGRGIRHDRGSVPHP